MSSNPYVVRTDAFLGYVQTNDWKPQEIAVEKIKLDRECSRQIQRRQTRYLKMLSTPNEQELLAQILTDIETIQILQTEFQKRELRTWVEFNNVSRKLKEDLSAVEKSRLKRTRRL
jgi:KaiC/GvpD/RAD55 family RecA-like ATPase